MDRGFQSLAHEIPQSNVNGALGHLVIDRSMHYGVYFFAIERVEPKNCWAKNIFHDCFNRSLRLTVSIRAPWGGGGAGDACIRLVANKTMIGGCDPTSGKSQRMRIVTRTRNCS